MNSQSWRRIALVLAAVPLALLSAAPAVAGTWVIVPSPNPHVALNELNAVFARTATDAWAVGRFGEVVEDDDEGGLVLHWNGTAWAQVTAPNPQARNERLDAVDGSGANDVWAVGAIGTAVNGLPRLPFALHWNGSAWSQVTVPTGPTGSARGRLGGVKALSATNAWAVGKAGNNTALVEHFDGAAWSITTSPVVNAGLNAVFAVSATNIWAVGDAVANADGTKSALIEHFDGASWQRSPNQVSVPANFTHKGLKSLVALSANDIWAVGTVADNLSVDQPLIQHFNGTTWTRVAAPPRPANTTHYGLSGIAAVSPTDLAAVGLQFRTDLTQDSMVLEFNGTAWSFATVADSGAPFDSLSGVAVTPGGGPLWAVGHSDRSGPLNPHTTLILRR